MRRALGMAICGKPPGSLQTENRFTTEGTEEHRESTTKDTTGHEGKTSLPFMFQWLTSSQLFTSFYP